MATILFTGFPGFLGAELLPRVLTRRAGDTALCVVQSKFLDLARRRADELGARHPAVAGRIRLVEGDITRPGLALADRAEATRDTVEIHHLAAIYDLAVRRDVGMKVNVEGTRNVLALAGECPRLERLHYVSTCYVSGRLDGVFTEDDLERGQRFNNFYEETKYLAEVDVRARMREGLPATIYRPAITVGDSATGETQKYDGPYHVIQLLLRQPFPVAVMPTIGAMRNEVNLVPRDFVVGAIAHLSGLEAGRGRTYQLADPQPLQAREILDEVARATGKRVLKVPLTAGLAKTAIARVPGVERLLRVPPTSLDYFTHPTRYDTRNTLADLAGSGIRCPPFGAYVGRLVAFMRDHPEIGSAAMA